MAKAKSSTAFFCKECGFESVKWLGQCPACKQWNTLVEEPVFDSKGSSKGASYRQSLPEPVLLGDISSDDNARVSTGMKELDRVLGGGLVKGSLSLVGGDPGIGKSTLLLQICHHLANSGLNVIYVSGEESLQQIKMRAERMHVQAVDKTKLKLLCETDLDRIESVLKKEKPDFVVIDSIQTMFREDISSAPGSVSQVRESTITLMQLSKIEGISIVIVGHVTKEGVVAGPRVLEHMVDTVLYFEGDKNAIYRLVRSVKNRFGSTNEVGVFKMNSNGLEEVENPSAYMLEGRPKEAPGDVVACSIEGSRAMMLEIQALVCHTSFGVPRRTSTGTDYNRLNVIMAVMEKRAGLMLGDYDAYLNITGGLKLNEPALDLAIAMAIASSFRNRFLDEGTVVFGEIGLSGEIRGVSQPIKRVAEAAKLGFKTCILPMVSIEALQSDEAGRELLNTVRCIGVSNLCDAFSLL